MQLASVRHSTRAEPFYGIYVEIKEKKYLREDPVHNINRAHGKWSHKSNVLGLMGTTQNHPLTYCHGCYGKVETQDGKGKLN